MVDDMGFSDIGCYGGEVETPNLDRLAAGGLRFTQFYNAGRCCPTRASLLTGLYPHKTGVGYMTGQDYGKPGYRADLSPDCATLAEVLGRQDYRTYMVGKWHVCHDFAEEGPQHNWPLQRGFDKFFGTLIAAGSFWNPLTLAEGNRYVEPEGDFYYTEALTDRAIEHIRETGDERPFFLYLAHSAPHWPLHARDDVTAKYRGRFAPGWDRLRQERHQRLVREGIIDSKWNLAPRGEDVPAWEDEPEKDWQQTRMEAFAAMIDHVDQGIGKIVEALRETGQFDNTLILFLSDNGGDSLEHPDGKIGSSGKPWAIMRYVPLFARDGRPVIAGDVPGLSPGPETTYAGYGVKWANLSNAPFRMYKKYVHEGGIATPLIVHWPQGIRGRGELRRSPGHVIDILPTCLEVARATHLSSKEESRTGLPDGQSLTPVFNRDTTAERTLFWEHEGNRAVRRGTWKIVSKFPAAWELYDLEADRTETRNLAARHPDRVKQLAMVYDDWAQKSQVLSWASMKINVIASKVSPLRRTDAEMRKYLEVIGKLPPRESRQETPGNQHSTELRGN